MKAFAAFTLIATILALVLVQASGKYSRGNHAAFKTITTLKLAR